MTANQIMRVQSETKRRFVAKIKRSNEYRVWCVFCVSQNVRHCIRRFPERL